MAIAFSVADAAQLGFQPTGTLSFDAGVGNNRYLLAIVYQDRLVSETLTTASYADVGMTELLAGTHSSNARDFKVYGLAAPATGTNTFSCSGTGSGTFRFMVTLAVYTGVHQSTAPSGIQEADFTTGDNFLQTLDIISQEGDLVVSMWADQGSNRFVSSSGSSTVRHNEQPVSSQRHVVFDKPGAASTPIALTWSGTCNNSGVSLSLPTADAGGGGGSAVPIIVHHRKQMEVG